jgi:hypothetical protein
MTEKENSAVIKREMPWCIPAPWPVPYVARLKFPGTHSFTDKDKEEIPWRRFSFLAYFFVLFVIGLPVWYYTTTPYRAHLANFPRDMANNIYIPPQLAQSSNEVAQLGGPSVWDELPIMPKYAVHLIFIHEKAARSRSAEERIRADVNRLANCASSITYVDISGEHFWNFRVDGFVKKSHVKSNDGNATSVRRRLEPTVVPSLITEIDKFSAPIGGSNPLIKVAVIFGEDDVTLVDEEGRHATSLAVASWGGIVRWCLQCKSQKEDDASISGVLQTIRTQLGVGPNGKSESVIDASSWDSFKTRAYKEHMTQTVHFISALNTLTESIDDLVISDEVSRLANESVHLFHKANELARAEGVIDTRMAAHARILAEKAAKHPTLLKFLNFPSDQKYAIYLPLFAPLMLPMMEPVIPLLRQLLRRGKKE